MIRNRLLYSAMMVLVMALGLLSRQLADGLPFMRAYAGDVLWALMVFFGIALVLHRRSTKVVASLALLVSFGVEASQLYHAPWINMVRGTRLGGLVLGFSFLWTDLLCYTVGVIIGCLIDWRLHKNGR